MVNANVRKTAKASRKIEHHAAVPTLSVLTGWGSQPSLFFLGSGKESIHSSTRLVIVLSNSADNKTKL